MVAPVAVDSTNERTHRIGMAAAINALIVQIGKVVSGHQGATKTNDNAAAGEVGEVLTVNAAINSVALVNNTAKDVCALALTAGDWDVYGIGYITGVATTTVTAFLMSLETTANTFTATVGAYDQVFLNGTTPGASNTNPSAKAFTRFSVASAGQTVHLVAFSTFAVAALGAGGTIFARRVR
jgi:hypothetical protein